MQSVIVQRWVCIMMFVGWFALWKYSISGMFYMVVRGTLEEKKIETGFIGYAFI